MKPKILFLVLLLSVSQVCLAQGDLKSFLAIKNIFDPNRTEIKEPKPTPTPKPVVEKLTLTGVMSYDQKEVAFFSGSRPEWSLPIEGGGVIAGMKLEKVDGSGAMLSGKFLAVGASFSKTGNGVWEVTAETPAVSAPPSVLTGPRRVASNQGRRSSFSASSRGSSPRRQASQMAKPAQYDNEVTFPDFTPDWADFHDHAEDWGMPPDDSGNADNADNSDNSDMTPPDAYNGNQDY